MEPPVLRCANDYLFSLVVVVVYTMKGVVTRVSTERGWSMTLSLSPDTGVSRLVVDCFFTLKGTLSDNCPNTVIFSAVAGLRTFQHVEA